MEQIVRNFAVLNEEGSLGEVRDGVDKIIELASGGPFELCEVRCWMKDEEGPLIGLQQAFDIDGKVEVVGHENSSGCKYVLRLLPGERIVNVQGRNSTGTDRLEIITSAGTVLGAGYRDGKPFKTLYAEEGHTIISMCLTGKGHSMIPGILSLPSGGLPPKGNDHRTWFSRFQEELAKEKDVKGFVKSSKGAVALMQCLLLCRIGGPDALPENGDWMLQSKEVLETILCSGDVPDINESVLLLNQLAAHDPAARGGVRLRIAWAVALAFWRPVSVKADLEIGKTTYIDPVARYTSVCSWVKEGTFFEGFQHLTAWHMRCVVVSWRSDEELAWVRSHPYKNMNTPGKIHDMGEAMCGAGGKKTGASVQDSKGYYGGQPVTVEAMYDYGGVCGAISYMGTAACQAYGVPAMPMGSPGHCSFLCREKIGEETFWVQHNSGGGDWYEYYPFAKYPTAWVSGQAWTIRLMEDAQRDFQAYAESERLRLSSSVAIADVAKADLMVAAVLRCRFNLSAWLNLLFNATLVSETVVSLISRPHFRFKRLYASSQSTFQYRYPLVDDVEGRDCQTLQLKEVRFWVEDSLIRGFEQEFDMDGQLLTCGHGLRTGAPRNLKLEPGESISKVGGTISKNGITQVIIWTNKQRQLLVGSVAGKHFRLLAPRGYAISALVGQVKNDSNSKALVSDLGIASQAVESLTCPEDPVERVKVFMRGMLGGTHPLAVAALCGPLIQCDFGEDGRFCGDSSYHMSPGCSFSLMETPETAPTEPMSDDAESLTVTYTINADMEVTFATASWSYPKLVVDKVNEGSLNKEFTDDWNDGSWQTLAEGCKQFNNRGYKLKMLSKDLVGMQYFQGPCHSGKITISITSDAPVLALFGQGNGNKDIEISVPVSKSFDACMITESLSKPGFVRLTSQGKMASVDYSKPVAECETKVATSIQATYSIQSDMEVTFATASASCPELVVEKVNEGSRNKEFTDDWNDGSWLTLAEGCKQFNNRGYKLKKLPEDLVGMQYFQGPCHSGKITISITSDAPVLALFGKGNGNNKSIEVSIPVDKSVDACMITESLSEPGFIRLTTCQGHFDDESSVKRSKVAVSTRATYTFAADMEVTFATASWCNAKLVVDEVNEGTRNKEYKDDWNDGSWQPLAEGCKQFNNRSYKLTKLPEDLIGMQYFQGPCHSGKVTISITSDAPVLALFGKGNGTKEPTVSLPVIKSEDTSMRTDSFGVPGFVRLTTCCPDGNVESVGKREGEH